MNLIKNENPEFLKENIDLNKEIKILFFDAEMTGGKVYLDDIIQFSLLDFKKGILFDEYMAPRKVKSWKETEEIHNITPEMVEDKPTIKHFKNQINDILKNADILVGFGIENDLKFMGKALIKTGANTIIYDLQKTFSKIYSDTNIMPSLSYTAKYFDCPKFGTKHNSLIDSYIIAYIFAKMYNLEIPLWLDEAKIEEINL